jgi:hypothetical protein
MDSEPIVDSTCTKEHITWVGISGVHGEGSSETRNNVVQCSAGTNLTVHHLLQTKVQLDV